MTTRAKSGTVSANGIDIWYDSHGSIHSPTILLIMGLGSQSIAWPLELVNGLVALGFRVIRFDNRDSGLSTKIKYTPKKQHPLAKKISVPMAMIRHQFGRPNASPYTLFDMADDTAGLLDALDIKQAHIVGASMGGMIAQIFAANYPQKTLSLTSIMSSTGASYLPPGKPAVLKRLVTAPPTHSRDARIEHLITTLSMHSSPGYPSSEAQLRKRIEDSMDRCTYPPGVGQQFMAILASKHRIRLLKKIKTPTLVIHGLDDPLIPASHGKDTAKRIKDTHLVLVPGMGHDLPAELMGKMIDWIGQHASTAQKKSKQMSSSTA